MRIPVTLAALLGLALPGGAAEPLRPGATAGAFAEIHQPLALQGAGDLDFGGVIAGGAPGRVVVAPDGTRTALGGALLVGTRGGAAAVLRLAGQPHASFTLSLPGTIQLHSGLEVMPVDTFVTDGKPAQLDATGRLEVRLGAALQVATHQAPGVYAGSFLVTVAYN